MYCYCEWNRHIFISLLLIWTFLVLCIFIGRAYLYSNSSVVFKLWTCNIGFEKYLLESVFVSQMYQNYWKCINYSMILQQSLQEMIIAWCYLISFNFLIAYIVYLTSFRVFFSLHYFKYIYSNVQRIL